MRGEVSDWLQICELYSINRGMCGPSVICVKCHFIVLGLELPFRDEVCFCSFNFEPLDCGTVLCGN